MPRYGKINTDYIATWFEHDEPGGPMWALNLMKYRQKANYSDGRESDVSGVEADDLYAPVEHLRKVGSRLIFLAPVVHQLVGDDWVWDRIAIAQYRDRMAMVEMSSSKDFQKDETHKEAGMEFTLVMATFPAEGHPVPPQASATDADKLVLLQVVGDAEAPDAAEGIESIRIGRFEVEGRLVGDDRNFAEARWDLISRETADELAKSDYVRDTNSYVIICDPTMNDIARSLTDPTQVLF